MERSDWDRVTRLFERLLEGAEPEALLAAEPDQAVREKVAALWRHHCSAETEEYLAEAVGFEVGMVFSIGQILMDRFHIEARLGTGGMGEVYLAWDARMEDRVALKTIARLLAPSAPIRRRFTAEVLNARRITHPNVCRIYELFEEGEVAFFSMEYVPGTPLSSIASLTPANAVTLVRQMAEALHAAHQTGVVHGDFKPSNVMVVGPEAANPRAVIMDFGLARALDRTLHSSLGAGNEGLSLQAGTLDYMAPELRAGEQPTVRSDIYAFGKVAEHLLPSDRKWKECTQEIADRRPASLENVIRHLQPRPTRRYWLAGLSLTAAAVASRFTFGHSGGFGFSLPVNARVLVLSCINNSTVLELGNAKDLGCGAGIR